MAMAARRRRILTWCAVLAVPLAAVAACGALLDTWMTADPPHAYDVSDYPGPDGRWVAVRETVDNGLGFGQGMLYYEVHVQRPGARIASHGNDGASVVFYVAAEGAPPRVSWGDATHLLIEYEGGYAGRQRAALGEVRIAYRHMPKAPKAPKASNDPQP